MSTLFNYMGLYLKMGHLLLRDVFENFRMASFKTYELYASKSFTFPGFSYNCMLKYTKCKLETLLDIDMLMFIEREIRGGISQYSNRLAKANNK